MGLPCISLPDPSLAGSYEEYEAMVLEATRKFARRSWSFLKGSQRLTLKALSDQLRESRLELLSDVLKAQIHAVAPGLLEQEFADCPRCRRTVRRKRFEPRVISTLHGRLTLNRPYFYCTRCGHGFAPVDEALELAREVHQYDVQDAITVAAARMPYEEAVDLVERLTGISVSAHFGHTTLTSVAQAATLELVIPDREEIERRIQQAKGPSAEPPVLVVTADGAMAPVRPKGPRKGKRGAGAWREVRGVRLYVLDPDDQVIPIASWHQIQNAEAFRRDLLQIAERIPQEKVRICLVADGAPWVWQAMKEAFPNGREILDFFHCFEHLHTVARAQFGEKSLAGQQWAETLMVCLADGEVARAVRRLRAMEPANDTAAEEIRKLIGYLERQAHRIHYIDDLKEGHPIGSGAIESANKFICHARLKRSGAWWVEETGNDVLRIRCALYNGTYERVFQHYMATHKRQPPAKQETPPPVSE